VTSTRSALVAISFWSSKRWRRGPDWTQLDAATARLKDMGDEAAFQEQQRLRAARDEADRQLAALVEGRPDDDRLRRANGED
jgi:hypothetical protein